MWNQQEQQAIDKLKFGAKLKARFIDDASPLTLRKV